jgi:hypothetical protein
VSLEASHNELEEKYENLKRRHVQFKSTAKARISKYKSKLEAGNRSYQSHFKDRDEGKDHENNEGKSKEHEEKRQEADEEACKIQESDHRAHEKGPKDLVGEEKRTRSSLQAELQNLETRVLELNESVQNLEEENNILKQWQKSTSTSSLSSLSSFTKEDPSADTSKQKSSILYSTDKYANPEYFRKVSEEFVRTFGHENVTRLVSAPKYDLSKNQSSLIGRDLSQEAIVSFIGTTSESTRFEVCYLDGKGKVQVEIVSPAGNRVVCMVRVVITISDNLAGKTEIVTVFSGTKKKFLYCIPKSFLRDKASLQLKVSLHDPK